MKLSLNGIQDKEQWKGYKLPEFDIEAVKKNTYENPTWVHFGAGNIFRAFPAALLQQLLDSGDADTGVIVAEGFDFDIIDKAYKPYDNLSLLVVLKADGSIERKLSLPLPRALRRLRILRMTGRDSAIYLQIPACR